MMRPTIGSALLAALCGTAAAGGPLPPIEKVELKGRVFHVNGRPFFPLMAWLQDAKNFPLVSGCAMNATAGYWPKSSGTQDVTEYLPMVEKAGLYGVMPFEPKLKGHPALLGYIHDDEPDLTRQVSDAEIVPAKQLRINNRTPLWKILDGDRTSWSVLDPMEGAAITIKLKAPVTVESLALWPTISKGLAVMKEAIFEGDGTEILKATVENKKGEQKFPLPKPATFKELTMKVVSAHPGDNVWGSLGEIEGFDKEGKNALLSPPRTVPRATPAETLAKYKAMKAADPTRPIFMTLTGNFHPFFKRIPEELRRAYPDYVPATDVIGYDIYPIYGWNKPEWIHLVQEATDLLVKMAGDKPVYAWIETSKGGQWTGDLARQKEVTPAHIRAEVWMSITRGATAIGYFTHIWKPSYHQFGVPEANRKALREINEQITRLTPAILGAPSKRAASIASDADVKLDLLAKEGPDGLYLFAVNYDERLREAKATIKIEGLAAGSEVTVVDENRTLKSDAGSFTDTFAPLAVRIYRILVPPRPRGREEPGKGIGAGE
ncbi:MAG: hypothetical protein FJ291_05030 [Planctomycetes bacterium]|nr:hypothetical protein [Planctomycetota bacterium]